MSLATNNIDVTSFLGDDAKISAKQIVYQKLNGGNAIINFVTIKAYSSFLKRNNVACLSKILKAEIGMSLNAVVISLNDEPQAIANMLKKRRIVKPEGANSLLSHQVSATEQLLASEKPCLSLLFAISPEIIQNVWTLPNSYIERESTNVILEPLNFLDLSGISIRYDTQSSRLIVIKGQVEREYDVKGALISERNMEEGDDDEEEGDVDEGDDTTEKVTTKPNEAAVNMSVIAKEETNKAEEQKPNDQLNKAIEAALVGITPPKSLVASDVKRDDVYVNPSFIADIKPFITELTDAKMNVIEAVSFVTGLTRDSLYGSLKYETQIVTKPQAVMEITTYAIKIIDGREEKQVVGITTRPTKKEGQRVIMEKVKELLMPMLSTLPRAAVDSFSMRATSEAEVSMMWALTHKMLTKSIHDIVMYMDQNGLSNLELVQSEVGAVDKWYDETISFLLSKESSAVVSGMLNRMFSVKSFVFVAGGAGILVVRC